MRSLCLSGVHRWHHTSCDSGTRVINPILRVLMHPVGTSMGTTTAARSVFAPARQSSRSCVHCHEHAHLLYMQYRPAPKKLKFRPSLSFLLCTNIKHGYCLAIVLNVV